MTQKELMYVEDAILHETNIINICNETIDLLEEEDLVSFFEKEVKKHSNMLNKLTSLLEDKANE